jgi:hypothetical protein
MAQGTGVLKLADSDTSRDGGIREQTPAEVQSIIQNSKYTKALAHKQV